MGSYRSRQSGFCGFLRCNERCEGLGRKLLPLTQFSIQRSDLILQTLHLRVSPIIGAAGAAVQRRREHGGAASRQKFVSKHLSKLSSR